MRIGIIGAGMIGATLGSLWMRAGHAVRFGTRHPDRVRVEGALATTVAEAAAWAEVLLLAVPLGAVPDVAGAAGAAGSTRSALEGKVVLDATNPMARREPAAVREIEAEGTGSGRWVARHLRGARVVKAFNTVYFQQLRTAAGTGPTAPGIPLAGDDASALATASQLVRDAGFEPVVAGPLDQATRFEVGTPAWNSGATAAALRSQLRL